MLVPAAQNLCKASLKFRTMTSSRAAQRLRKCKPLFRSYQLTPTQMDPNFTAPAPENPALVIRQIPGTGITTFSTPFARGGFLPIGGRSVSTLPPSRVNADIPAQTAVKLSDGSVFLVASHALCPTTLRTLRALGPVESLVAIDLEHNMFIPQYALAYPQAKVYAPE